MSTDDALGALREALRAQSLVPVIGAGVSMAIANLPSWSGLIQRGIVFAEACGGNRPQDLAAAQSSLDSGQLLDAAQWVKRLLHAPGGQFAAWLDDVFGSTPVLGAPALLHCIADLMCPIVATTNYDNLLEQMPLDRFESVTWREPQAMLAALRKGRAVFHLHGIHRAPDSVVFGADNYDELVADSAYRSVLETLWISRTMLFVGCSFDGLRDPDFTRLLQWFARTFPGAAHRHFALMLVGTTTEAQRETWLHEWRVQVIPYGPTHDDLAPALRALNVNAERAYARRMHLSKSLLEGQDVDGAPRFVALLEGASATGSAPGLREAAAILFRADQTKRRRQRQDLAAMQLLTRSIVDPQTVAEQRSEWQRFVTRFEGRFRETVRQAAGALFLFEDSLLNALKLRGVNIHQNVLQGMCRTMLDDLENLEPEGAGGGPVDAAWYQYQVENMQRILSTVEAILQASPEQVFPESEPGTTMHELFEGSLLVLWADRIELRSGPELGPQAYLPLDMSAVGGSFVRFRGTSVVTAFTQERVIAWDPSVATPVAEFSVGTAFGINSVDHQNHGDTLESLVVTTDGFVHRLRDFREVEVWRPVPSGFLVHGVLLPDGRVFALTLENLFRVVELQDGECRDRLTAHELANQLPVLPRFGRHWMERIGAERQWERRLPWESSAEENLAMRFQHPDLGRLVIGGKTLLMMNVQLNFHVALDSIVLLLDPDAQPLHVAGHFLVAEGRILADFDMRVGMVGDLTLVGVLLSDFKLSYDLAVWAKGANTRHGIVFVQQGSTLRTNDDLIRIACGNNDVCVAADDSGGLFRFSLQDKTWKEVDRRANSRIRGLRIYGGLGTASCAENGSGEARSLYESIWSFATRKLKGRR